VKREQNGGTLQLFLQVQKKKNNQIKSNIKNFFLSMIESISVMDHQRKGKERKRKRKGIQS